MLAFGRCANCHTRFTDPADACNGHQALTSEHFLNSANIRLATDERRPFQRQPIGGREVVKLLCPTRPSTGDGFKFDAGRSGQS